MWLPFRRKSAVPPLPQGWWLLVPLGNPGEEYEFTRHNLGRQLLSRWVDGHGADPRTVHRLCFGSIHSLGAPFMVLVPSTFMNHSGKAALEATKLGFPADRMLFLHDDKDLPLGVGRLSLDGRAAGHGGVASVQEELGTQNLLRLRLGMGPFQRPLREWVLGEWEDQEWETIEGMDAPFAAFMSMLADAQRPADMRDQVNALGFWKNTCNGPSL